MKNQVSNTKRTVDRRSFMKSGLLTGGAATVGVGLLANGTSVHAQFGVGDGRLDAGDIAILRFLAAAELLESDLWTQYAELGWTHPEPASPRGSPGSSNEHLPGCFLEPRWGWSAVHQQQHAR
jgi:hypothetical protein